jgi:hypothetical protein
VQLGVGIHTLEVDVDDLLLEGVVLHIAQQHFTFFASQFHVEHGGVEGFLLEGVPQGVVVKLNQLRLCGAAIDDAGRFARIAQTAARTRSLLGALKSDEFHSDTPKNSAPRPVSLW